MADRGANIRIRTQLPLVLVDMDGTLADVRHRLHFIRQPGHKKKWHHFFEAMDADQPIEEIAAWVRELARDHRIVIVTGRPEDYRARSEAWLRRFQIPWDDMLMRPRGDHRPDYIVKKEMLLKLGEPRPSISLVIDDRPAVCAMWREAGLKCHQVEGDEAVSPEYEKRE